MSCKRSFCIEIMGWSTRFMNLYVHISLQVWEVLSCFIFTRLSAPFPPSSSGTPIILIFVSFILSHECIAFLCSVSFFLLFSLTVLFQTSYLDSTFHFYFPYGVLYFRSSQFHFPFHSLNSLATEFLFGWSLQFLSLG